MPSVIPADGQLAQQPSMAAMPGDNNVVYGIPADGPKPAAQVIGREEILKAQQTLNKYKEGKANLEQRIVENEQWFKLRHWECMRKAKKRRTR